MRNKGIVVLPTILIFGAITIGIVLTGVFVIQLINRSNFGIRLAVETSAAAQAAIEDIHVRLLRDDLSPVPVVCNDNNPAFTTYDTISLGRAKAKIQVCRYSCGLADCGYRARADAETIFFIKRRLEAVFGADPVTGQVKLNTLRALEF